jgi:Tol biopolymer transport system component
MAWAPDGQKIAFGSDEDTSDIWLMDEKGHNERAITRRFFNFHPNWSPDSGRVAFSFFTRLEGPSRNGIAVMHADGRNRRELTDGVDSYPVWRP